MTTRDASGQETVAVERDTNGDGVLESQGTFVLVAGEWVRR